MPERYLGQQLGKYRISRFIGSGSFSWVYEVTDTASGGVAALKILRPEFLGDAVVLERFAREIETTGRLRHPNIVSILDTGVHETAEGQAPWAVMELFPLTLSRRLALVHRLPESEVVKIGLDITAALGIAHAAGVVHRDVKPDNILLAADGRAALTDFGLAGSADTGELGTGEQVAGTPHYFSPEQARGMAADGRSDLYSLGVTLFRAATGELPFDGDDWTKVAAKHVDSEVPGPRSIVPALTPDFAALLLRLMAKDPAERIQSATRLADRLAQLPTAPDTPAGSANDNLAGATLVAPVPLSALSRKRRRARQTRIGVIVGALLLAFGTGLGIRERNLRIEREKARAAEDSIRAEEMRTAAVQDSILAARRDSVERAAQAESAFVADNRPEEAAKLRIDAQGNAVITVNGRSVAAGALVEFPHDRALRVNAKLADAPPGCRSALSDTTVRLGAGETRTIVLGLRSCGNVTFDAIPPAALVRVSSQDDGYRLEVRADSTATLLLPAGRYTYSASHAGYHDFREGEFTVEPLPARATVLRIRLLPRQ